VRLDETSITSLVVLVEGDHITSKAIGSLNPL